MKLVVFSYFPIPRGLAATTRMIAYSKGMAILGVKTEIVSMYPYSNQNNPSELPENLKGTFIWNNQKLQLTGKTKIDF